MEIYKKILLLLTIIIATIILVRLLRRRAEIKNPKQEPPKEPMTNQISMMNTTNLDLPLNQYCVKSSWNSAYDYSKNIIDLAMLKTVLKRGCRFIDMEIYSIDKKPVVAFSSQPTNYNIIESNNSLPLEEILTTINQTAFINVPNPKDPLFIQMRFKTELWDMYKNVPAIIQNCIGNALYKKSINQNTNTRPPLSDFAGKITLILDVVNSSPTLKTYTEDKTDASTKFNNYFAIHTSTDYSGVYSITNSLLLQAQTSPPTIQKDGIYVQYNNKNGNMNQLQESFPDISTSSKIANPEDPTRFIRDYGINIIPYRFYMDDKGLSNYEELFSNNGNVAFIPMSTLILYITPLHI
jgi:hypothetical protein